MMQYYQEITLLPDGDFSVYFLWGKIFTAVHIALAEQKNRHDVTDIAVSFPQYGEISLGNKLRILAEEEQSLELLDIKKVLRRFDDYVHITGIRTIPTARIKGYAMYSRYQPDSSIHQKARRYSARHSDISYEQALTILKSKDRHTDLPYIQMRSMTNHNPFRLFIKRTETEETDCHEFGSYGLSSNSAVPEF